MARFFKLILLPLAALLAVAFVVVRGINSRTRAAAIVRQETLDLSVPTVAVMNPKTRRSRRAPTDI
jgi:hypothetical protein